MKQVSEGMKGASYPSNFSLTEMAVKLLPSASKASTFAISFPQLLPNFSTYLFAETDVSFLKSMWENF